MREYDSTPRPGAAAPTPQQPAVDTAGRAPATGFGERDRTRQVAVTGAALICAVGTLVGLGVIGGADVPGSASGAFAADATYIAPASPAFGIWSVIYVGLASYTVWQWRAGVASSARHRSMGYLAAATMVLNAAWLLVATAGWVWVSVVVIGALAFTLGLLVRRLTALPPGSRLDAVITDGTFGLYLGWVSVATCANVAAALAASGVRPEKPVVEILAAVIIGVAVVLALVLAVRLGARYAVAGAMAWGLAWIGYGRWVGPPISALVSLAAFAAALTVPVLTLRARGRAAAARPIRR